MKKSFEVRVLLLVVPDDEVEVNEIEVDGVPGCCRGSKNEQESI